MIIYDGKPRSDAEIAIILSGLEDTIAALRRDCQELEQGRAMAEAVTMDAEAKLDATKAAAHEATNEYAARLWTVEAENARLRAAAKRYLEESTFSISCCPGLYQHEPNCPYRTTRTALIEITDTTNATV